MRYQGRVIEWNDDRGFGFIEPNGGGERIFLHIKAVRGISVRPSVGQVFNYTLGKDERGRPRVLLAQPPRPVTGGRASGGEPGSGEWRLQAGFVGCAVQVGFVLFLNLPMLVLAALAALNLLTFSMYWLDKRAARLDAQRTPESTLHLASMLGGWPAALMAQRLLRHKSVKQLFQTVFWMTAFINLLILLGLGSAPGQALLSGLLGAA
jgi:uncharacterized membrane protein YsdA (DUF1294 family)/cold shock CspA family protein